MPSPILTRRKFLRVSALAAAAGIPAWASGQAGRRPNFVFMLADDLGSGDLGCYGNTFHETPRIDRLASASARFTHAYAASAVCSPTRASILTGKYPARLSITDWIPGEQHPEKPLALRNTATELPLAEVTFAEALRSAGYQTAYVGKWHLGGRGFFPEDQGFGRNVAGCEAGQPPNGYFSPYKLPTLSDGPPGEYLTDRLAAESVRLLERFAQQPDKPFLLYHAFYQVHMPIQPKPELKRHFDEKRAARPDPRWTNTGYAAMNASLDEAAGKILDALDRLRLSENTVVVFTSDNGGVDYAGVGSNFPLRAGKGRYYEGGIRVPLIVRWPGVTRTGMQVDSPVISTDYYPTLLEMAGLSARPAQHPDGLSLVPLLRGRQVPPRDAFFWHYPHYHGSGATPSSTIRAGQYKLMRFYETGTRELYDLDADPGETLNLLDSLPAKARELDARLDSWLNEVGGYIPARK